MEYHKIVYNNNILFIIVYNYNNCLHNDDDNNVYDSNVDKRYETDLFELELKKNKVLILYSPFVDIQIYH
jgi:hypothetical protein